MGRQKNNLMKRQIKTEMRKHINSMEIKKQINNLIKRLVNTWIGDQMYI